MLINMKDIKNLSELGLRELIVDCMTRAAFGSGSEYKEEQIQNALNAALELKARSLGVNSEELEEHPKEKPLVKLAGEDGNVFNIIGLVSQALKKANQKDKAEEFQKKAFTCGSYDEVLVLLHEYVEAY